MNVERQAPNIRPAKQPAKTLADIVGKSFLLSRAKREAAVIVALAQRDLKADTNDPGLVSDAPFNFTGLPRFPR